MTEQRRLARLAALLGSVATGSLAACASISHPLVHYQEVYTRSALTVPDPEPGALSRLDAAQVRRGRYLVQITGCAGCHTDGALIGEPDPSRALAGSQIGIAYTDPMRTTLPGVAFAANLTPDAKTGLGRWTDPQIIAAIRGGAAGPGAGQGHRVIMPWPLFASLADDDVNAIVQYLRSIPAIEHRVPASVPPGVRAAGLYVYFGVFRSGPFLAPAAPGR